MSEKADKTSKDAKEKEPDFEAALEELESVVQALESGELSLADSLDRFKRGVQLSKRCHELIDDARQTVEMLADPDDENSAEAFESAER